MRVPAQRILSYALVASEESVSDRTFLSWGKKGFSMKGKAEWPKRFQKSQS